MKRLAIVSVLAALIVSGCAWQRGRDASNAQEKLVGMPKHEFVNCAGEPWTQQSFGSKEMLLYIAKKRFKDPESVPDQVVAAVRPEVEGSYCEARVTITDGRVSEIRYSGQTGGFLTEGEACAPIIQGCL